MGFIYNRRQDVNVALYDYMQLKQESSQSGFGCNNSVAGVCGGSTYVFDGSMYGYKRIYNSVLNEGTEGDDFVTGMPLELRCLVPRVSQSNLRTL